MTQYFKKNIFFALRKGWGSTLVVAATLKGPDRIVQNV